MDFFTVKRLFIMWNQGLQWAIAVAQQVEKLLPEYLTFHQIYNNGDSGLTNQWYHIEAYQNGREQGLQIWVPTLKEKTFGTFCICEHRNGKSGFYFGRYAMQSLSQDAYENGFTYVEDSIECAKLIVKRIKEAYQ